MDNIDDIKTKCGIFTDRWFMAYDKADRYTWAIVEKQSSKVIGRITGMNCDERTEQIELAYEIGENWWNLGYMTEVVKKIIEFFIEEVGFSRIYCSHAPDNPPSGKVMEKCGMKYEGTLRQAGKCNIGIYDELMYSVLKKDYHV